jgi:hypothetical protein
VIDFIELQRNAVFRLQEQVVVLLQKIKQTMKAAQLIQLGFLLLILSTKLNAQSASFEKVGFLKKQLQEARIDLRFKNKKADNLSTKETAKKVTPKFSMDVYDGKGIHVLTISNVNFLPTMKIGVAFNAKVLITI